MPPEGIKNESANNRDFDSGGITKKWQLAVYEMTNHHF
jgi:hypothetical protein